MRRILFLVFLPALALGASDEIEYTNDYRHFTTSKSSSLITFKDESGLQELKISKCNKKQVGDFWSSLVNKINNLQSSEKIGSKTPSIWVKFEGAKFKVLEFEPARKTFDEAPFYFGLLMANSARDCK